MVKMVEARNIKKGDVLSTDGLVITEIEYHSWSNSYYLAGPCHGVWKEWVFGANEKLPIYVKEDSDE